MTSITKAQLDTVAKGLGLPDDYVQLQFSGGKTLTEIANTPVFAMALAGASAKPERIAPVEPAMPIQKQGESMPDFMKRFTQYTLDFKAYSEAMKAYSSRKREWSVGVNLTKGTFNIAVPDGSIWLSADGMEELLKHTAELADIANGKTAVKCKADSPDGEKPIDKGEQKISLATLRTARAEYRKSEAGKAASDARRATFKSLATK